MNFLPAECDYMKDKTCVFLKPWCEVSKILIRVNRNNIINYMYCIEKSMQKRQTEPSIVISIEAHEMCF